MTAIEHLNALQARQQALIAELRPIQNRHSITLRDLAEARNAVRGYEQSTRPGAIALRDAARTRLAQLQEQVETESDQITALQSELDATKAQAAALFEGQDGYAAAVAIYQEAKAHVTDTEAELQAHHAKQQTAARALEKAQQASETAGIDLENAMDATSINRARTALTKAQQAETDADTLVSNLKRHQERLTAECDVARKSVEQAKQRVFQVKAALLAEECRQRLIDPALDAFAAARLAGSGWSFKEWLAATINPNGDYLPPATEAHQAALIAALDTEESPHA